ncbi:ABC transporter substrate-binding protein [Streptomyces cocklensis]|uniref:Amino acid ABC transporter substrate-binding protein, PAAT family n=1 Tax=Actinacidiphila cocklensis TaxID=887465 RepID=A0A9W4GNZ9_9ACTN|nr:ABC transporter substrate-binding protein [Actinacidiphila cocklensis]MDD1063708.1 ABC transporter substrate-binding protein [Actinacidiphila cocklensis]WSX72905.1 ABC transporter substrate-binding protein [Streptomyces sp. NBC_00899]WSX81027.1 ABC transporter substrate-binding protein [Streptomyces sp. NBC_00899]CAG6391077.1 Amino acid ABC transporter substrate-binding protein, PAAT family [Actinacidiphila cocklensis]
MRPVNPLTSSRPALAAAVLFATTALALAGCSPQDDDSAAGTPSAGSGGASAATASTASCTGAALPTHTAGKLTVGTDNPAYEPWFSDDKPSNGKGYESAVAYAVAERLGFGPGQVVWQTVPFNSAFSPGAKNFDFDINQVSVSDERKKAVDFSPGYYDVRQAVVARKDSPIANARSLADLKKAALGAQVGTTSLDTITDVVKPDRQPAVFQRNDLAVAALKNGQVDGIVVDLPTAFYITGAQVQDAKVVGQFASAGGPSEQFGLVLDKGSRLTSCVSAAVTRLRTDGTLAALEKQWLSDAVGAPVLK